MRPRRSLTLEIEDELSQNKVVDKVIKKGHLRRKGKVNSSVMKFKKKLEDEQFKDFTHQDWLKYFQYKSKEKGLLYIIPDYYRATSVIKSAMGKFSPMDIKNMIDFIYESGQDKFDYTENAVMSLSKGWISFTYNTSKKWKSGELEPQHNLREWKKDTQPVNDVEIGSGITI